MRKFPAPIIDIKKYGGKQVAIFKGRIIASDTKTGEVLKKARMRLPRSSWRDILLISVPTGLTVVYRL
jgi:hypothetical protein